MRYRRQWIPGASYFFTLVTHQRRPLLVDNIKGLRQAFRVVKKRRPFTINAIVVLPDHLHCILTLPDGDSDYPTRWRLIKTRFTQAVARGHKVWQNRYWEHILRDSDDFANHMDYIHYNPVKHGLTRTPIEWPHSSLHRCIRAGLYPQSWADEPQLPGWVGNE